MRLSRRAAHDAAADLHHHDRLAGPARRFEGCDQAFGFADSLGIQRDHIGVVVVDHHLDHLAQRDVGLVARHCTGRQPDARPRRRGQDMAAIGAGLADDGDAARARHPQLDAGDEAAVEAIAWIDQAQRVGAQHAHAMPPGSGHQGALRRLAFRPGFGEACAEYDGGRRAALREVGHHLHGRLGCDGDDRHVGRLGKCVDRGVRRQALHRGATRVDRQDAPGEALRPHVGDRAAADA